MRKCTPQRKGKVLMRTETRRKEEERVLFVCKFKTSRGSKQTNKGGLMHKTLSSNGRTQTSWRWASPRTEGGRAEGTACRRSGGQNVSQKSGRATQ